MEPGTYWPSHSPSGGAAGSGGSGFTLLCSSTNTTAGVYYSLTKSVTLVGEVSSTKSKSAAGESSKMSGVSLGGILFF